MVTNMFDAPQMPMAPVFFCHFDPFVAVICSAYPPPPFCPLTIWMKHLKGETLKILILRKDRFFGFTFHLAQYFSSFADFSFRRCLLQSSGNTLARLHPLVDGSNRRSLSVQRIWSRAAFASPSTSIQSRYWLHDHYDCWICSRMRR